MHWARNVHFVLYISIFWKFLKCIIYLIYRVVNIWSGPKPFIKVVLKSKCIHVLGQRRWTFLIHFKCWLLYIEVHHLPSSSVRRFFPWMEFLHCEICLLLLPRMNLTFHWMWWSESLASRRVRSRMVLSSCAQYVTQNISPLLLYASLPLRSGVKLCEKLLLS